MKTLTIASANGILIGMEAGEQERQRLHLDDIDKSDESAIVQIETPVVMSDYIRGLVGPSVRQLGFDRFMEKYHFHTTPSVRQSILANARFAFDEGKE